MPKKFLLLTTLFFALYGRAQQLPAKQYNFTHYTTASGLISNQVNNVIQDKEGYIWITTTDGLQRFDGVRYKTFRHDPKDSTSIPYNIVSQMVLDKKGNLWLLFNLGKICIFNTKTFVFKEVKVVTKKDYGVGSVVQALIADEYDNMFLMIAGTEILTYKASTNEFSYKNNFFKQKDDWHICSFIQQPGTHKYWISVLGGGLSVYNHSTGNLSSAENNIEKEPIIEQYKGLKTSVAHFFDSKNRLWFVNWNPAVPIIYCYDFKTQQPVFSSIEIYSYFKAYHEIHGFYEQKDGTIWIRGIPVLAKYIETEKKFQMVYNGYNNEQGISYSLVNCLFEDREKNLWVTTDNNGLFRFNPSAEFFTNVKHINRNNLKEGDGTMMSFMETKWGTLLAGAWGDGMYEYDKNLDPVPLTVPDFVKMNTFAWWMTASADSNHIWIASQPGIYSLNQQTKKLQFYNPPALEGKTVRQIVEDKHGNLWIGMFGSGVFKWTASKGQKDFNEGIAKFTDLPAGQVGKIFIDSKGLVWIGVGVDGLYVIDPDTDKIVMHFSAKEPGAKNLPEVVISSVGEYDDSTMIITTATMIIAYNRNANTSTIVGTSQNISGYISAFEKDKNGYLWLTTSNGLYRINIQKKIFVYFNRIDGIENEKFSQPSSYVMHDGRMIFGTSTHFIVFDPLAMKTNTSFSDVTITDFKVFNKALPLDSLLKLDEIELDYKENALTIEFSPLLYNSASLIRYKLSGIDKNWVIADKNDRAIYNYLPPGTYTFLIKTMNENGKESVKVTMLKIKINAPFWRTWWFYSLLALLVLGLLFWLDRQRTKRKEAVEKMRTGIADKLHQEVNTALNNINILSEMAKLKADKDIEKSKEYI
ncbi:ligand-binding sensor domain-containing protein [Ferruginibacter sp.]